MIKKLLVSIVGLCLFFGGVELALRLVGFSRPMPAIVIRGEQDEEPSDEFMIDDPELQWRLNPGATYRGSLVNVRGFCGREFNEQKIAGTIRVMCLGDSCTAQGIPPYSAILHQLLVRQPPDEQQWESINLGVHGYSAVQGLKLFQIQGRNYAPDFVTIYFGWNDHWLGVMHDHERQGVRLQAAAAKLASNLQRSRVFQAMTYVMQPPHRRERAAVIQNERVLRVPEEEYRWTLKKLVREIRAADAVPILLTAPRAKELTPLLVKNGQTRSVEEAMELHDRYVEITRDVAQDLGVELLDLATLLAGDEAQALFSHDGIHLRLAGRERVADEIHRHLTRMVQQGL